MTDRGCKLQQAQRLVTSVYADRRDDEDKDTSTTIKDAYRAGAIDAELELVMEYLSRLQGLV